MKSSIAFRSLEQTCLALCLTTLALPAVAQQPTAAEHVAQLKAVLAASQAVLRQYEWIQTTIVSVKGEEKSRKQERCFYGADNAVQKVTLSQSAPPPKPRGLFRRKIAESKQKEMTEYMNNAVSLVSSYVPPNPARIQAAKDMGRIAIEILQPGIRARLNFRDYERPGDNLGVEVDLVSDRPLGLKVDTYLEDAKDTVSLDVRMGQLNDGTTYPSEVTLDAPAKTVRVTVKNGGYSKLN
jgi:hypothetical protein